MTKIRIFANVSASNHKSVDTKSGSKSKNESVNLEHNNRMYTGFLSRLIDYFRLVYGLLQTAVSNIGFSTDTYVFQDLAKYLG